MLPECQHVARSEGTDDENCAARSALVYPTIRAESAAVFGPALGSHRLDTATAPGSPMSLGVVASMGVDHARPLNRVATQAANRWNCVDQRQQLHNIVDVRASQDRGERCAVGVGDDVILGLVRRAVCSCPSVSRMTPPSTLPSVVSRMS